MRGPNLNSKAESTEEAVVSELPETKLENDTDNCHLPCNRSVSNASSKREDEDNNKPIWKVGRILIESLSKGKMRRTKIFGAPLEDLPLNCQGIPKIVQRLCSYLEQFGLNEPNLFVSCKKHGKFVERYKISFDRAGDADLENCSDVKVIASLLKLWLHDLPHPLIPQRISQRLKTSFQKYDKKEIYDLDTEICNVLITCPALNLGVLYTVIRLLYSYVTKWYSESQCDQLPEMFAKILIGDIEVEHVEVINALIHNFHVIFDEKILERAFKLYVVRDKKSRSDGQKLHEVTLGVDCKNSALTVEKLPRSNSEEKLTMQSDHNQNLSARNLHMRRVNSHEDFSGSQHNYCRTVQGHLANSETKTRPRSNLEEFEADSIHDGEPYDNEPVVDHFQKITFASDKDSEALVAPPPFNYYEDDRVSEEIRNEERFTPQFNVHRCIGRKKRTIHQGHNGRTKVPDTFTEELKSDAVSKPGEFLDRNVNECITCPDESIELCHWNTMQDCDAQSTSSTSSSSSSDNDPAGVPSTEYSREHLEPFNSYRNWSYTHRHPFSVKSTNLIQSESDEDSVSSYVIRLSDVDSKISQINKHLQWTKKRLRYYDKIYKDGSGDTLTGLKEMANQEYKQLSKTIILLKKNLKQLRKEANENFVAHRSMMSQNLISSCSLGLFSHTTDTLKAAEKALKHLQDRRVAGKRPECVEDMTHMQLLDEKVSIHETLLSLENTFGQTTARNDESFKSIYERYRAVRRFIARSSISLKMKDAVSDLATIMENETMEFDTGSSSVTHSNDEFNVPVCQDMCKVTKPDFHTSNIHELSSPELMLEYKITKEEKKKLRTRIYLYEQETENQTFNDSKHCIHSLRSRYKNTKAKLKLLEALLMKTK